MERGQGRSLDLEGNPSVMDKLYFLGPYHPMKLIRFVMVNHLPKVKQLRRGRARPGAQF